MKRRGLPHGVARVTCVSGLTWAAISAIRFAKSRAWNALRVLQPQEARAPR